MNQSNRSFQELYESLHDTMLRVAYRMVGTVETAEDLVQDTFLLALFQKDRLALHPSPEGWLMRALQNLARNEQRRLNNHSHVSLDSLLGIRGGIWPDSLVDILPKQLSEQDQKILRWLFEQNMGYDEIADRLSESGIPCSDTMQRAFGAVVGVHTDRIKKFLTVLQQIPLLATYNKQKGRKGGSYGFSFEPSYQSTKSIQLSICLL